MLIPLPAEMTLRDGFVPADTPVTETIDPSIPEEGYELVVGKKGVAIKASSDAGLFYARQTLAQLAGDDGIPYIKVVDAPRLPYRGLHLDVSRHFFDKRYVMKLLDAMGRYKMNRLHLHLTDGQGWRIQIDKYPLLTTLGARGGGFYTKDDVREILKFAAERHITIIPEIEMPGHSSEVFAAYPSLTCPTGHRSGDFCIGNEDTFAFVEGVLTEIMELFPSELIHIGGDEASKRAWLTCPLCRARMRREGLKNVDELQSYMIRRVEKFLRANGRRLIGWDEILQGGGLDADAVVMAWRNEPEGYRAARMGHDVVMTPQNYLYFDYYQADPATQPRAIGGYTTVKWVYSFDPAPADSLSADDARRVIGVQGNTWTEYIATPEHLEYMQFPRALAVAEIGWTPQSKRSWPSFKPRLNAHIFRLRELGFNPFTLSTDVEYEMTVDTLAREIRVALDTERHPAEIRYTLDGTAPDASSALYEAPLVVRDSAHIVAALFSGGRMEGRPTEKKVDYHRGLGRPVSYRSALSPAYMAGGLGALTDGYRGSRSYHDLRWQGYTVSLDCTVDMGAETALRSVSARFMQLIWPQVFQPGSVELLTSLDGVEFVSQGVLATTTPDTDPDLTFEEYTFRGSWSARYVRLVAHNAHPTGYGFIFLDEIVIW